MANYNPYGGGDQYNTSYGAQGGAAGGGFLSSQGGGGSQGQGKKYANDTLRPVTIRQLLAAVHSHPDSDSFVLDDQDMTQVSFVAQIRNISTQTTHVTYKMDDGTGIIEVKKWIDSDADNLGGGHDEFGGKKGPPPPPTTNSWARVCGTMKQFNSKRHVASHVLRPIADYNEIQFHLLEATFVHLYITRGPPDQFGSANPNPNAFQNSTGMDAYGNALQQPNQNQQQQQQQQQQGQQYQANGANNTYAPNQAILQTMSPAAKRVYEGIRTTPQNNEGLHIQHIAQMVGLDMAEVWKAGDELIGAGLVYTTVNDSTWSLMEG